MLPAAMTKSLRRGIFDRSDRIVAGELGKVGPIDHSERTAVRSPRTLQDPIDGLPRDLLVQSNRVDQRAIPTSIRTICSWPFGPPS